MLATSLAQLPASPADVLFTSAFFHEMMDGDQQANALPVSSGATAPSSSLGTPDGQEFVVLDGLNEAQTQQVVSTLVLVFTFINAVRISIHLFK